MLPRPCLSFMLPSIHDNTKLDCRVYHPRCLRDPSRPAPNWSRHAAVVAHPYAPLGGCFDDPIVDVVAGTLLQLGFVVATFNFRGAGTSDGRTSWTSKPEQADYISVVGFLAYYVHHLDPSPSAAESVNRYQLPTMLLAGYSYGAMVATRLPSLDTLLAYFATPAMHTAEADIRLRAQYLAEAQRALSAGPTSPRKSLGIRVGGDEDGVRRSHDHDLISRFQREENIQESVRDMLTRAKLMYRKYPSWSRDGQLDHRLEEVKGAVAFQSAYLAVSPPVGLMTRLASMSFTNPLSPLWMQRSETVPRTDQELTSNPTLVIYGDRDRFISYRKMHDWTRQLSGLEASQFRHIEVPEAGHFWTESVVVYQRTKNLIKDEIVRDAVGAFATELTTFGGAAAPSPQMS